MLCYIAPCIIYDLHERDGVLYVCVFQAVCSLFAVLPEVASFSWRGGGGEFINYPTMAKPKGRVINLTHVTMYACLYDVDTKCMM